MLTSLTLENFKSFRSSTVRFGSFTVIMGTNASGKSNLFDALRFLHFIGQGSSIRDAIEGHTTSTPSGLTVPGVRGGSKTITHLGSESSVFRLVAVFENKTYGKVKYCLSVDADKYKVVNEELVGISRHPGPYVFSTNPESSPLVQNPDGPVIEARYYTNAVGRKPKRMFSSTETILSQFVGRQAHSNQNEVIADFVREEMFGFTPLELLPETLRQYSNIGAFQLGEHGENFAALVWLTLNRDKWARDELLIEEMSAEDVADAKEQIEVLDTIKSWLSELTPHPIEDIETLDAPTGEVIFALREEPFNEALSARSLSDGTLRFAALTFALFGEHSTRTLMIEEVENGINPNRLEVLVRMLESASGNGAEKQVLATAHAPGILNFMSDRSIGNVVVMGWDYDKDCSHPVRLVDLPDVRKVSEGTSLGQLQQEGWLQLAADL